MKAAVVMFPGSNCDQDAFFALRDVLSVDTEYIWHNDRPDNKTKYDLIVLPGGFSFGDYLRTGAIARFSPVMDYVKNHVEAGGLLIGICNGFQILLESGLLPGAMLPNNHLSFICDYVYMKAERNDLAFTNAIPEKKALKIPIAHFEGNYFAPKETIDELESQGRCFFATAIKMET
jgi:phosphoribosylformylglycinamidine synthase